jgi:hypothetical protein
MTLLWSGSEHLQGYFNHLSSSWPSIQFTGETESESVIPLLGALVIRPDGLVVKAYRKPTHTGRYLIFNSNEREVSFRIFTKELPPEDKDTVICAMKLVASDAIFSCSVIPEVSLSRLLTSRAAVSGLCVSLT